ncbi:hypothetical protein H4R19_000977 [Coemansia spiralis]|nr:hypothetical protein H4R19_000977 [Coemansia spiralis]
MAEPPASTAQPVPRRRFQRRPPSAEMLADLRDQNTLGAAAGFFFAVWAARLMGEPLARVFTDIHYGGAGGYGFGPADAAVVALVASKLVFVRTCLARYIVRPLVRARLPDAPFDQCQRQTGSLCLAAMRLLSVCVGVWAAAPALAFVGAGAVWGDAQPSATLGAKCCVLALAAFQLCDLAVAYAEGLPSTPFPVAKALLALGAVASAAILGAVPLAGAAAAVSDLPCLVAAVIAASSGGLLPWAARALLSVAMWTCPPALLYVAVVAGPTSAQSDTVCRLLIGAVAVLALSRMAAVLRR